MAEALQANNRLKIGISAQTGSALPQISDTSGRPSPTVIPVRKKTR